MRFPSTPSERRAPLRRFAFAAFAAAALLAGCQGAATGGDTGRFDRTASADSAKRVVYGGLSNQR